MNYVFIKTLSAFKSIQLCSPGRFDHSWATGFEVTSAVFIWFAWSGFAAGRPPVCKNGQWGFLQPPRWDSQKQGIVFRFFCIHFLFKQKFKKRLALARFLFYVINSMRLLTNKLTFSSMCRKLQCSLRQLPCCQYWHMTSHPSADGSCLNAQLSPCKKFIINTSIFYKLLNTPTIPPKITFHQ